MKSTNPRYLGFTGVPLRISEEIGDTLGDYSVALGRLADATGGKFEIYGGGALVCRGERCGVLTARHCLNKHEDPLLLVLKRSEHVVIPPENHVKHLLGVPWENDLEPDLAFVEILPGSQLKSIRKLASFCSLDEAPVSVGEAFGKVGRPFTVIGFPEGVHHAKTGGKVIKSMAFFYGIGKGSINERDDWDYVEAQNIYGGKNEPRGFKGIHSGPVWGLQIVQDNARRYILKNFTLIGMAFLSARITKSRVLVRAHFIKSIYERAWKSLEK